MRPKITNIMLIGFGPHSMRVYGPLFFENKKNWNSRIACIIDLEQNEKAISQTLTKYPNFKIDTYYIPKINQSNDKLTKEVKEQLEHLVNKHNTNGVIIATDPISHVIYANWALSKNLSILMDKPISIRQNASLSLNQAKLIESDYEKLLKKYNDSKKTNPNIVFSLVAQRRYDIGFIKIRKLIEEVHKRTNCPVTSIQSFHSDGQWRMPHELIDIDYHGYNKGYGICSHSGYHIFDIVPWLLEAAESENKKYDNVDINAHITRSSDLLSQLNLDDYKALFKDFEKFNKYNAEEYKSLLKNHGEVDVFSSFAFKHGEKTITLGSVNLLHTSFSQRGWLDIGGRDLYKENGRIRQETHIIHQGPFQSIYCFRFKSEQDNSSYQVGGEKHFDIHVFRNDKLIKDWNNYDKITFKELEAQSKGEETNSKAKCIAEFLDSLNQNRKKNILISDLNDHRRSTELISGVYRSIVLQSQICSERSVNVSFKR